MDDRNRFILKPRFGNLAEYQLHFKDILTYVTIRSYYNRRDKYAYPSYEAIKLRSGLSTKFIGQSVRRLEAAGLMDIWKVGKFHVKHCYQFDESVKRQKIPEDLLETEDLNSTELSILLLLADSSISYLDYEEAVDTLSKNSGLVKKTVQQHLKVLTLKGYIAVELFENPLDMTLVQYVKFTNKLKWNLGYSISPASLKATESGSQSWGMNMVEMASNMIRDLAKSSAK